MKYEEVEFLPQPWDEISTDNLATHAYLFLVGAKQIDKLHRLKLFIENNCRTAQERKHVTLMVFFADPHHVSDDLCGEFGLPRENILQFQRTHHAGVQHYISIEIPEEKYYFWREEYTCLKGYRLAHQKWGGESRAIEYGFAHDHASFLDIVGKKLGWQEWFMRKIG